MEFTHQVHLPVVPHQPSQSLLRRLRLALSCQVHYFLYASPPRRRSFRTHHPRRDSPRSPPRRHDRNRASGVLVGCSLGPPTGTGQSLAQSSTIADIVGRSGGPSRRGLGVCRMAGSRQARRVDRNSLWSGPGRGRSLVLLLGTVSGKPW